MWTSFSSNVSEWSGLWTIWDAHTKKVKDVYSGVRSLKALNDEKTIIQQTNTYYHQNGTTRKSDAWEIRKENCDENGICHPARPDMRAILHDNRNGAWVSKEIPEGKALFNEIFIQGNCKVRCSVGIFYDASKQLVWFSGIREHKTNSGKDFWSSNTELQKGLQLPNPEGNFVGVEKTLTSKLDLSVATDCRWDERFWLQPDENRSDLLFYLPDNICLSCPRELCDRGFVLRSCVVFTLEEETEIQELTATYVDGRFVSVRQGLYRPSNGTTKIV